MAETKREFHFWVLPDYEQEEEYLRNMHQNGWKLVRVAIPGIYTFERCEPADVVYKLDFRPLRGEDREAYLSMYREYGWEYLQTLNDYCYFRKSASDASEEDLEIFNDTESRLDMVRRILRWRVPIVTFFALFVLIQSINVFQRATFYPGDVFLVILYVLILALYVYIIARCAVGFRRLWRKYAHTKE